MGTVFRKTFRTPLPAEARIIVRKGLRGRAILTGGGLPCGRGRLH